jgi:hypothetical protein
MAKSGKPIPEVLKDQKVATAAISFNAFQFLSAYHILSAATADAQSKQGEMMNAGLEPTIPPLIMFPTWVCLAFSNELYLKALLVKSANTLERNEHNHTKLFQKLPAETQAAVLHEIEKLNPGNSNDQKMEFMEKNAVAFVEYRYFYDIEGGRAFMLSFAEHFSLAMKALVDTEVVIASKIS